jgi:hypothetical protein
VGVKELTSPLTLALSCGVERGEKERFNGTPHFCSLPQGERREKREIYLIKSILFVFVNFGVFKV